MGMKELVDELRARCEEIAAAHPEEERARRVEEFRKLINPYIAAGGAFIDDVIDPRETRPVIIRALEMAETKVERPWKKHGGHARMRRSAARACGRC
jgi:acetyl-CoA carboxylase carboxyltransferase component